jgi:crotonobetaine/carnitine-CoA ligase
MSANVISQLIQEKANTHQNRPLLFYRDETVTYAQLEARSNQVAHCLRGLGLQKNDKVAVMMHNHPNYLYTWFGSLKVGAVEVPINTAYKGELLKHILTNSQSKLLVIDGAKN